MQSRNTWLIAALFLTAFAKLSVAQQPGIAWLPDIETAKQLAAQSNKLVLVHFWSTSCQPCMRLEHEVFNRPETAQSLNANFACVKVNAAESDGLVRAYNVTMLPTDVVLSADGRLIAQLRCPPTADQYIQQLSHAAAGYRQLMGQVATQSNQVGQYAQQAAGQAQNAVAAATALSQPTAPQMPVTAPNASSSQGAQVSAYSDDRYADYMRSRQPESSQTIGAAAAGIAGATNTATDYASRYPGGTPSTPTAPPVQPNVTPPQVPVAPANYPPQVPSYTEQRSQPAQTIPSANIQLPPNSPPLALDGYCTVQLKDNKRWVPGDRRFGAIHRGRTYLFTGPDEQTRFLASPDSFAPVISGDDPVLAMDNGQAVPGKRDHGVFYDNRIFLFADEATLQRFYQNPNRYAAEVVQAMR